MNQEDPWRKFNILTCASISLAAVAFLGLAAYEWSLEDEPYGSVFGKELPLALAVVTAVTAIYVRP